ncbi:3-hydroxyacyl-CoA dehydrogenase NAD-binding domain-containing protein [Mesorhizobium sp. M0195]
MDVEFLEKRFTSVVCVGAGNIGAGWAAHFMRAGLDVIVYDPLPERQDWLDRFLEKAMPALEQLGLSPNAKLDRVRFTANLEGALSGAEFVQESSPEVLSQKKDLFQAITDLAPPDAIVASSSAGFLAKDLRVKAKWASNGLSSATRSIPPILFHWSRLRVGMKRRSLLRLLPIFTDQRDAKSSSLSVKSMDTLGTVYRRPF